MPVTARNCSTWLERYTFPSERALADPARARAIARTFFDLTLAAGTTGPHYLPPAYQMYAVEPIKEVVKNIPIVAVGRINDPLLAESVIAEGKTDIVAMARPLIADPDLPNKAKEGRLDDIRPCMGDNLNCVKYMLDGQPIRCICNATVGMEHMGWGIGGMKKAATKKKVVAVGGGPAGLEAARVAALRGHDVTLYEKAKELGGQALQAEMLPGREEMGGLVRCSRSPPEMAAD